jgi:hypothetical protein
MPFGYCALRGMRFPVRGPPHECHEAGEQHVFTPNTESTMIKRLLAAFGKNSSAPSSRRYAPPHDLIYELLFCDRLELFRPTDATNVADWQKALFEQREQGSIAHIANDPTQESRVRLLAYRWLAAQGFGVASKEVLGVVVEVGLDSGNDTLAAYADGSVRYINQSGKLAVFEGGPPEVSAQAKELARVSRATVDKIGPWEQPRREPPDRENIRLSFLVADGLYFGEGPYSLLRRDPMAADVIAAAERLLQLSVQAALAAT